MNKTITAIVNSVLSARSKKAEEFVFVVNNREYVLYPDGNIWRRKRGKDLIKKFSFNGSTWITDKGRPALVIKDMTTKLVRRLETMAPRLRRGTKTKIPKGAKPTPQKTLKNKIDRISSRKTTRPLKEGIRVSKRLVTQLKKLGLSDIEVAGSIRRKMPTVGDIDLMAIGNIGVVKTHRDFQFIKGRAKSVTFIFMGHQVNLYAYKKSFYGAMLMFLTGPGPYNIALRRIAKSKGMKLSQYGLTDIKTGKILAAKTEERIYKKLGKEYKRPELRGRDKIKKTQVDKISWMKLRKDPDNYVDLLSVPQLVQVLDTAADAYYNTGKAKISDAIFDLVWDELKLRAPRHPRLKKVGAPIKRQMGKVKLPFYLGSLDKLKPRTVDKWLANNPGPYVVSDKMDGLSLGLDQKGPETKLYTRGNGREGQDVSHLVSALRKAKKIPKKIPDGMQIRCEVEMTEATFKKYFPEGKSARNTASGLIGQKKVDETLIKRMDIIAYEIIKPSLIPSEQLKRLKQLGFKVVPWGLVKNIDSLALNKYFIKRKAKSPYTIDGIVIYLDQKAARVKSGNPKNAKAFKDNTLSEAVEAKIESISWQISKHGYLKPVANLEPVKIGGATIRRVTLYNAKYVKDNLLGPGAVVQIIRSGDVIPKVIKVIKKARKPSLPNENYVWNDSDVEIMLPDTKQSTTVTLKNITNFFTSIGVEGFKQKTIERLYKAGYDTVPKIILITEEELLKLPGIQKKNAEKLRGEINTAISGVEIHKLAFGSGTFGRTMGSRRLKEIFTRFPSMYKKAYKKESVIEAVKALPGYKEKTASDFAEGLPKFLKFLRDLPKSVKIIEPKKVKKLSSSLEGEVIVFTGFRNSEWQEIIEKNGGQVGNSVSRKTTILVTKDINSESGKVRKATNLGIKVMDIEGFRRYLDKTTGISI